MNRRVPLTAARALPTLLLLLLLPVVAKDPFFRKCRTVRWVPRTPGLITFGGHRTSDCVTSFGRRWRWPCLLLSVGLASGARASSMAGQPLRRVELKASEHCDTANCFLSSSLFEQGGRSGRDSFAEWQRSGMLLLRGGGGERVEHAACISGFPSTSEADSLDSCYAEIKLLWASKLVSRSIPLGGSCRSLTPL